ncbi:hypothetical protein SCH4B_3872 [Ruegeria sp. TrichCH4B]|nr:hypothetical protein SCH4B_3872 [Ruegeria sp. TrichCH4B]
MCISLDNWQRAGSVTGQEGAPKLVNLIVNSASQHVITLIFLL